MPPPKPQINYIDENGSRNRFLFYWQKKQSIIVIILHPYPYPYQYPSRNEIGAWFLLTNYKWTVDLTNMSMARADLCACFVNFFFSGQESIITYVLWINLQMACHWTVISWTKWNYLNQKFWWNFLNHIISEQWYYICGQINWNYFDIEWGWTFYAMEICLSVSSSSTGCVGNYVQRPLHTVSVSRDCEPRRSICKWWYSKNCYS